MEKELPASINIVGILIIIFSALIIVFNGLGSLAWSYFEVEQELSKKESDFPEPFYFLIQNFTTLCQIMLLIGIAYLIGGIFLRKQKLWANYLVCVLSVLLIILIWRFFLMLFTQTANQDDSTFFSIQLIYNALAWSTPIGALIWYLNKKDIKKHFS